MHTMMKTDSQIRDNVIQEIQLDSLLEGADVQVVVSDGIVTLTGTVDSYAKRLAAQEIAHRVAGVLDVANDVRVDTVGRFARSDTDIARTVRLALEWDVLVPDHRITSTVADGWVTLEGTVGLWREREDAEHAVRNLAGVRGVTNLLVVRGPRVDSDDVKAAIESALKRRAERVADHIQVAVDAGKVTLTGRVQSWQELQAVLGTARSVRGVEIVDDHLVIEPY